SAEWAAAPRVDCRHRVSQWCLPASPGGAERHERLETALAGLDAAAVCVAAVGVRGCVAPVALDLPALAPDRHGPAEGPRTLVGVLVAFLVVPGVELRVGQHLAEFVP